MGIKARFFLAALLFLAGLGMVLIPLWVNVSLAPSVIDQVKNQIPSPATYGLSHWKWPAGVVLEDISVNPPLGSVEDRFIQVKRLTLKIPWWGIFLRPIPVMAVVESPSLRLDTTSADFFGKIFFQQMGQAGFVQVPVGPQKLRTIVEGEEDDIPEEEPEEETQEGVENEKSPVPAQGTASFRKSGVAIIGLQVRNGRIDLMDRQAKKEGPVATVAHLNVGVELSSLFGVPVIQVKARGDFVAPPPLAPGQQEEIIGFTTAESHSEFKAGKMEGRLQIWHGRLKDLRNIYYYAPEPFFFDAGAGGPILEWKMEGPKVKVSMRCLTEGLRIGGTVGGVAWKDILKSLEGSNGKIDITVSAQGRLDDPAFDVHDRLLSELDWLMQERAAAAGVGIPQRIFFGLEKSLPKEGKKGDDEEETEEGSEEEED